MDRVVHHALLAVIEPPLDARFYPHSYACRRGKGVHRAVDQYQQWARRFTYVLKLDIARYFPSIDHRLLKARFAKQVEDGDVRALMAYSIDSSPADDALLAPG